jgi:hypothetical protein
MAAKRPIRCMAIDMDVRAAHTAATVALSDPTCARCRRRWLAQPSVLHRLSDTATLHS